MRGSEEKMKQYQHREDGYVVEMEDHFTGGCAVHRYQTIGRYDLDVTRVLSVKDFHKQFKPIKKRKRIA